MNRIILLALLFIRSKQITAWSEVKTASEAVSSTTIAGPNEEYIVQGQLTTYRAYTINWQTGAATSVNSITIPSANVAGNTLIQADNTFNCIVSSKTIYRFNAQAGQSLGVQEYPVPTGITYSYPRWATGTNFMFISTMDATPPDRKVWRVHSDRITDVKYFPIEDISRAYEVFYGTGWLIVSMHNLAIRKLYDYTNGYDGGTNSAVQTHNKDQTTFEIGMFVPEDGRFLYVVSAPGVSKIATVKGDGTNRLLQSLVGHLPNTHPLVWVKDSDLCIVSSWDNKFVVVDFMDETLPTPTSFTLPVGTGQGIQRPQIWSYYKAFLIPFIPTSRSHVYKALAASPCSDLCSTSDGVFRNKCSTCDPNASKTGDACYCVDGFYLKKKSPTKSECLTCPQFCGTCSGGSPTDCLTCKYSYMEKKGDGSCGCPTRKFLSGSSCLECDPSCLTCSGASPSSCLSCETSNGKYQSGSRCETCHNSCQTCSGGGSNDCLS